MADPLEQSLIEFFKDTRSNIRGDRLEARQELQLHVADEIYVGRRSRLPATQRTFFALLIQRLATNHIVDLQGEPCTAIATVQFVIIGKHKPLLVQKLCDDVRICIGSYQGDIGENGYIEGSTVVRDGMRRPSPPIDATDAWNFAHAIDVRFTFDQQGVDYV